MVPLAWPENGQSTPAGVHGGTAVLLAMARPLGQSARVAPSELAQIVTNPTRSRTGETRQGREGFGTAEHSDEVGRTLVSYCGCVEGYHLGRACIEAYRGDGEHSGGIGAENGPLKRPAASGGASASNGAAVERTGSGCG